MSNSVTLGLFLLISIVDFGKSHPGIAESKLDLLGQKIWERAKTCSAQENISFDVVRDYSTDVTLGQRLEFPKNLGCYLKCMYIYDGVMTESGKITVPEKFPQREAMQECVKLIPDELEDKCARAIEAHKCHLAIMSTIDSSAPKPMKLVQEKKLFYIDSP